MKIQYTYTTQEAAQELANFHKDQNNGSDVKVIVDDPVTLDPVTLEPKYSLELVCLMIRAVHKNINPKVGNNFISAVKEVRVLAPSIGLAEAKRFVEEVTNKYVPF